MGLFERKADKNIKRLIVDNSYIDLSILGPTLAKYISMTTGEDYVFQPDAVMYAVHSVSDGEQETDMHIAIHYILLIKEKAQREGYIRGYNQDLSDIETSQDGIILFKSNKDKNVNFEEYNFTYPNDINGRSVDSETRKFPFYYLDKDGELQQTYENLGLMYSIIDLIIQRRINLEMTEYEDAVDEAVRIYTKK